MHILLKYYRRNWIIYSILLVYALDLMLNALGLHLWLPVCPISHLTGYECLGCGLNRAAISLLSGDFETALMYNPLIFIYSPIIIGWVAYDYYKFYLKTKLTNYEKY